MPIARKGSANGMSSVPKHIVAELSNNARLLHHATRHTLGKIATSSRAAPIIALCWCPDSSETWLENSTQHSATDLVRKDRSSLLHFTFPTLLVPDAHLARSTFHASRDKKQNLRLRQPAIAGSSSSKLPRSNTRRYDCSFGRYSLQRPVRAGHRRTRLTDTQFSALAPMTGLDPFYDTRRARLRPRWQQVLRSP